MQELAQAAKSVLFNKHIAQSILSFLPLSNWTDYALVCRAWRENIIDGHVNLCAILNYYNISLYIKSAICRADHRALNGLFGQNSSLPGLISQYNGEHILRSAAKRGHVEVLQWFYDHDHTDYRFMLRQILAHEAAIEGSYKTLEWLIDHNMPIKYVFQFMYDIAQNCQLTDSGEGNLLVLKCLHDNGYNLGKYDCLGDILRGVSERPIRSNERDQLGPRILAWAKSAGYDLGREHDAMHDAIVNAAKNHNIAMLDWFYENYRHMFENIRGRVYNNATYVWFSERNIRPRFTRWNINYLIISGQLDALKWIYSQGLCSAAHINIREVVQSSQIDMIKWVVSKCDIFQVSDLIEIAARNGDMDLLEYLHGLGYRDKNVLTIPIIHNDKAKIIDWLYGRGYVIKDMKPIILYAVENGELDFIKFLHRRGFDLNVSMINENLDNPGVFETIKWLIGQGYEVNFVHNILNNYVINDLEKIDWLIARGYKSYSARFVYALINGRADIIEDIRQKGGLLTIGEHLFYLYSEPKCADLLNQFGLFSVNDDILCAMIAHNSRDMLNWLAKNRPDIVYSREFALRAYSMLNIDILKWLMRQKCEIIPYHVDLFNTNLCDDDMLDKLDWLYEHDLMPINSGEIIADLLNNDMFVLLEWFNARGFHNIIKGNVLRDDAYDTFVIENFLLS